MVNRCKKRLKRIDPTIDAMRDSVGDIATTANLVTSAAQVAMANSSGIDSMSPPPSLERSQEDTVIVISGYLIYLLRVYLSGRHVSRCRVN